jgi:diguanylate cyclase (GGDEF)-like protein
MPFAIPAVGGYLVALAPVGPKGDPTWMAVGALLLVLSGASAVLLVRERLPRPLYLVPPLAYIGVVAAVRAAVAGSNPAYAALFILPLVWLALHGTRTQLGFGLVMAAGALMLSGPLQPEGWIEGAVPTMLVAPIAAFTIHRLVNKIRRQAAVIEDLSQRDPLTGAVTKRAWVELFDREIVRAERSRELLTVALIDVDMLGAFNEQFGPKAGDTLLSDSVAAWQRALRAGDILGRIEGGTFGIVLPSCSKEDARAVVERLRTATADMQTCSIGVAEWRHGETQDHVMFRVRSALRSAKEEGRDQVVVANINLDILEEFDEDLLSEPTLLEQEAAEVLRTIWNADDAVDDETVDDDTVDDEPAALDEDEPPAPQHEDADEEEHDEDEPSDPVEDLAVLSSADPDFSTEDLDEESEAEGTSELRRLLRDLSSAR